MKPRFQVGDRLKVVKDPEDWAASDWYVGDYFVVRDITYWNRHYIYWDWKSSSSGWPEGAKCGILEDCIELAEIADSPLWKALE